MKKGRQVYLYDTTLRDGAGREGISFTVEDKLRIARKLDELGVHFIEGGWPGSNPRDEEFFARAGELKLAHATIVAFGSTRHPKKKAADDPNLRALLQADTGVVTIVAKSWDGHVTQVLETTLDENLRMISDSVGYLKSQGRRVFLDAEHFVDGYCANPSYALDTLKAAADAGAECAVLCDTNGGALPADVTAAVEAAGSTGIALGIHTHNDAELAVANSLAAVRAGAVQVQGTINGYGERCGNANLCSIIPALKLKMGIDCLSDEQLGRLSEVAHFVAEVANLAVDTHLPYVGASAFAHKAGLHVAAMMKWEESYHHVDPDLVGNQWRTLVSELSGKGGITYKARQQGLDFVPQGEEARAILERVKDMESRGFQYDGAEASFELLVRRAEPDYRLPFELVDFMVVVEKRRRPSTIENGEELLSEATVKVKVKDQVIHTAAEGNGPVDALDAAMRKALLFFYPALETVRLVDYKVRVIDDAGGTGARVRVLIESSDGEHEWRTVGSSANIIEASWLALADSLEYWLLRKGLTAP